jgi:hypothetical protein
MSGGRRRSDVGLAARADCSSRQADGTAGLAAKDDFFGISKLLLDKMPP